MLPVFEIQVTSDRSGHYHYSGSVLVAAKDADSALEFILQTTRRGTNNIAELLTERAKVDERFSPVLVDNLMWQGDAAIVKNCIQCEDCWPGA